MKFNDSQSEAGDLPKGWVWTNLNDICLQSQYGWTTSAVQQGRLRLLRTTDITSGKINWDCVPFCEIEPDDKSKYLLGDGDIVISRAGSVGFSSLIKNPKESVFASYLIRFKPLIDRYYVAYFLKTPAYWGAISEKKLGIALANVNATKLKEIAIPLAPLNEQKRIVAKIEELFTRLDAGVEALKKVKAELKRYRQAVLKAAFEGKLTADWRKKNKDKFEPASKLLERIAKEREKSGKGKARKLALLDTSSFPELPEGWERARIGLITDALGGYAFKSKEYANDGFQIIKISNVKQEGLDLTARPCFIALSDKQIINKYLLQPGDILITLTGTRRKRDYGFVGMVKVEQNLLLNQRVARLRCHPTLIPKYIMLAMRSEPFRDYFFENETGNVGQGNVGMPAIVNSPIPFPSLREQAQIVAEIDRHFSITDEVEQTIVRSLKEAERLRQSILKKAFEGKLVPQDPSDEPAERLLERIKAEKVRFQNARKATKIKTNKK